MQKKTKKIILATSLSTLLGAIVLTTPLALVSCSSNNSNSKDNEQVANLQGWIKIQNAISRAVDNYQTANNPNPNDLPNQQEANALKTVITKSISATYKLLNNVDFSITNIDVKVSPNLNTGSLDYSVSNPLNSSYNPFVGAVNGFLSQSQSLENQNTLSAWESIQTAVANAVKQYKSQNPASIKNAPTQQEADSLQAMLQSAINTASASSAIFSNQIILIASVTANLNSGSLDYTVKSPNNSRYVISGEIFGYYPVSALSSWEAWSTISNVINQTLKTYQTNNVVNDKLPTSTNASNLQTALTTAINNYLVNESNLNFNDSDISVTVSANPSLGSLDYTVSNQVSPFSEDSYTGSLFGFLTTSKQTSLNNQKTEQEVWNGLVAAINQEVANYIKNNPANPAVAPNENQAKIIQADLQDVIVSTVKNTVLSNLGINVKVIVNPATGSYDYTINNPLNTNYPLTGSISGYLTTVTYKSWEAWQKIQSLVTSVLKEYQTKYPINSSQLPSAKDEQELEDLFNTDISNYLKTQTGIVFNMNSLKITVKTDQENGSLDYTISNPLVSFYPISGKLKGYQTIGEKNGIIAWNQIKEAVAQAVNKFKNDNVYGPVESKGQTVTNGAADQLKSILYNSIKNIINDYNGYSLSYGINDINIDTSINIFNGTITCKITNITNPSVDVITTTVSGYRIIPQ